MKYLYSLIHSFFFTTIAIHPAIGQVIEDGTTSTTITPNNKGVEINNGNSVGSNLFHSFNEFSIPAGSEAHFNNSNDVANIFSRVTGGNISQINGLIRANGTANLFLINPAGIIFGEGARLQLGGSFYGSTADSIVFPDGEFSGTDIDNSPLITVNAPIGLNFRDNSGEIINRSLANNKGLSVVADRTIALISGELSLETGKITTSGGNIELASIADNGLVVLEKTDTNFKFKYDEIASFGNIELKQNALLDTSGNSPGYIKLQGDRISLISNSQIISQNRGSRSAKEIVITGNQLLIEDNARIITTTIDRGNAANIEVNIADSIRVLGTGFTEFEKNFIIDNLTQEFNLDSLAKSTGIITGTSGTGRAGKITLTTANLKLQQGSVIGGFVFADGNSEQLIINGTNLIEIDSSGIFNGLVFNSTGNGNLLKLNTNKLLITNSGIITSTTLGQGTGGDIIIGDSDRLVKEVILLKSLSESLQATSIFTNSIFNNGRAGNIRIATQKLNIKDGGQIVSISGAFLAGNNAINTGGKGGNITINADRSIQLSGLRAINGFPSIISSNTFTDNNAGNISIQTEKLNILNNGVISSSNTSRPGLNNGGSGNTGTLNIFADSIQLDRGGIAAITQAGTGENITLNVTNNITLRNNSLISTQAFDEANGGNLTINTKFIVAYPSNFETNGNDILASSQQGQGGTITVEAESLFGIQEGKSIINNGTNDLDASSNIEGLDGSVFLEIPDINFLRETLKLSDNVIDTEIITTSNSCSVSERENVSSLVVKGKGEIAIEPTKPLTADALIIDRQLNTSKIYPVDNAINNRATNKLNANDNHISSNVEPVAYKDNGEPIYLARGIIEREDGSIFLTANATSQTENRGIESFDNCD